MSISIWAMALSMISFGFVHALQPGHGKATAAALAAHPKSGLKQLLLFCSMFSLIHSLNILFLVFGLKISLARLMNPDLAFQIQMISGVIVSLAGLLIFYKALKTKSHTLGNCECLVSDQHIQLSTKETFMAALGYGLIPSVVVVMPLMNVLQTQGSVKGVLVLMSFSFGVAAAPLVIGLISWASVKGIFSFSTMSSRLNSAKLVKGLALASGAMVFFLGLYQFFHMKSPGSAFPSSWVR